MTGKELAKMLGLSEAAVSFALNNKPGVSTQTRNRVKEAAMTHGFDFTKLTPAVTTNKKIYLIYYQKGAVDISLNEFGSVVAAGVENVCAQKGATVHIVRIREKSKFQQQLTEISNMGADGIILFGTELQDDDFMPLAFLKIPIVLLDNHFLSAKVDSIEINNMDGAYMATNYLIKKRHCQPGYLHCSFPISNFMARKTGFEKALIHNGYSKSSYILHELSSSIDDSYHEMLEILNSGERIATCYFADNDYIAIGVMKALKEKNYRIPEDVAIIGFDDISLCDYTTPGLTTVHVPKKYLGMMAAERLLSNIQKKEYYPINIQVSTNIVIRGSI